VINPQHLFNTVFQDGKSRLGAVVDVSAKQADGKPLTVRLAPCGSVEVRFVDKHGKPAKAEPAVELLVTPARGKVKEEAVLLASPLGRILVVGLQGKGERPAPALVPNAEGRLTIPALIPGATYRLRGYDRRDQGVILYEREFTAESGKTRRLADVVVP
jgi:hypothetical protein